MAVRECICINGDSESPICKNCFFSAQVFFLVFIGLCFEDDRSTLKLILSFSLPLAWFGVVLRSTYNGATISTMFLHILHKRWGNRIKDVPLPPILAKMSRRIFRFLGGVLLTLALALTFGSGFFVLTWEEGRSLEFERGTTSLFRFFNGGRHLHSTNINNTSLIMADRYSCSLASLNS